MTGSDRRGPVRRIADCAAVGSGRAEARPAVFRRSEDNLWLERRNIAKQHDSYQWQKLFWIGLGMLPYAFIGGGLRSGELAVTSVLSDWRRCGIATLAQAGFGEPTLAVC